MCKNTSPFKCENTYSANTAMKNNIKWPSETQSIGLKTQTVMKNKKTLSIEFNPICLLVS